MKGNQWFTRRRVLIVGVFSLVILLSILMFWFIVLPRRLPADAVVVPRDFPTIQDALDHVLPGASIVVQAGQGPFLGPLEIQTPDVSISSVGGEARLYCESSGSAIIIRADGVTVRGFVIEGADVGVRMERVSHSLIKDITVEGARLGIELVDSYGNTLNDLSVHAGETGIEITSSGGNNLQWIRLEELTHTGIRLVSARANSIDAVSVIDTQVGISLEQDSENNEILSCRFDRCAASGVEVLNSTNNLITGSTFERSGIGLSLRFASDNTMSENRISNCSLSGIELYKSERNLLLDNTITASHKSGVAVIESGENTLRDNAITDCGGPGISLESANTNLVFGNQLEGNTIGVQGLIVQRNRLLQNVIRENLLAGIVLTRGEENLLLGNQVADNPFGIALVETGGNHLLRNVVTNSSEDGLSLLNRSKHNILEENKIERSNVGILLASSSQNTIVKNVVLQNEVGLRLFLSGLGTRIEANSILDNELGIKIDAALNKEETILSGAEVELLREGDSVSSLVITNNAFRRNKSYDIWNQTEETIFAGGNRWDDPALPPGGEQGRVSSGVIVQQSAWRGSIAVGTRDSLEHAILGRLLQLYLQDKGFKVIDLIALGEAERLKGALLQGDVDLAWGDPRMLNAEELLTLGFIQFPAIAAQNRLVVVVSPDLAARLVTVTVSELSRLVREGEPKVVFAVPKTVSKGEFELFASTYNLPITEEDVIWTKNLEETEILLKLGTAGVGIVEMIEETLTLTGFSLLEDDKDFFDISQSALTLRQDVLLRYPEVEAIETELAPLLTTETMHSLATRVRLLHREPTEVAREFLLKEGLISW
jgi:osmoprotectant transport system substrate-binding protein